jgi:hypothetical protein
MFKATGNPKKIDMPQRGSLPLQRIRQFRPPELGSSYGRAFQATFQAPRGAAFDQPRAVPTQVESFPALAVPRFLTAKRIHFTGSCASRYERDCLWDIQPAVT